MRSQSTKLTREHLTTTFETLRSIDSELVERVNSETNYIVINAIDIYLEQLRRVAFAIEEVLKDETVHQFSLNPEYR